MLVLLCGWAQWLSRGPLHNSSLFINNHSIQLQLKEERWPGGELAKDCVSPNLHGHAAVWLKAKLCSPRSSATTPSIQRQCHGTFATMPGCKRRGSIVLQDWTLVKWCHSMTCWMSGTHLATSFPRQANLLSSRKLAGCRSRQGEGPWIHKCTWIAGNGISKKEKESWIRVSQEHFRLLNLQKTPPNKKKEF